MALTNATRRKMDDLDLLMDPDEVNCVCCRYNYHNGGECDPRLQTSHWTCEVIDIEECIDPKLVDEQYEQLRDEIEQYKEEHKEDSTDGYYV